MTYTPRGSINFVKHLQTVGGSKKDQREYHACGAGKKLLIYSRSKSQRARDRATEAKVVGGTTVEGIK